jgi:hypothetical protein
MNILSCTYSYIVIYEFFFFKAKLLSTYGVSNIYLGTYQKKYIFGMPDMNVYALYYGKLNTG